MLESDFKGRDKAKFSALLSGFGVLVCVGMSVALVPRLGAIGAACASSVAYLAVFSLALVTFSKLGGTWPADVLLPKASDLRTLLRAAYGRRRRAQVRLGALGSVGGLTT